MRNSRIRPLRVGDVCTTVNCTAAAINNGLLVVIIGINPQKTDRRGEAVPYCVRRVDGQPFPATLGWKTGEQAWFKSVTAFAPARKLKRIDPRATDGHDVTTKARKVKKVHTEPSLAPTEMVTSRVSYHEGELHSRPDSTWAVSFAYFRKMSPKDALDPTPKLDEGQPKDETSPI